ncbi:alcohol dehydrogenase catalytic domain-containing protein [Prauserella oleivorans]
MHLGRGCKASASRGGEGAVASFDSEADGTGAALDGEAVPMKAFVMKEIGRVGFLDKPMPRPGPSDAIVRTTSALICTSDTHTVAGGIGPREDLTLGHEGVGVVHEVGSEVRDFHPGERVLAGAITPDWGSSAAQNGYPSQSGGRSAASSSPTARTGSSPSTSTSTTPTPTWRKYRIRSPMRLPCTALTCCRPDSWERRRRTSRSAERSSCSPRGRWG